MRSLSFSYHPRLNPPCFPELRVLHKRVIGVEQRQDQARHAIAKPLPQPVHLEESEDGVCDQLMHMEPPSADGHLLRHQRRVAAHLPQILAEVTERVLQDMAAQVISPAHHVEAFMYEVIPVSQPVLVEKLRLAVVRVPTAVPDPASQEKILPRHKERISPWATCEPGLNLLAQLVRRALVGINAQHPVVRHQLQRAVTELPKADKVALIHLVGVFPADPLSPVGAM